MNQPGQASTWVSLGTYQLNDGTSPSITLKDSGDGFAIADAVQLRWSETNPPPQTGIQVFHVHTFLG